MPQLLPGRGSPSEGGSINTIFVSWQLSPPHPLPPHSPTLCASSGPAKGVTKDAANRAAGRADDLERGIDKAADATKKGVDKTAAGSKSAVEAVKAEAPEGQRVV